MLYFLSSLLSLLSSGANVNASKMHQTSLHLAARQDSVIMIELLLEAGTTTEHSNSKKCFRKMCVFHHKNPFAMIHLEILAVDI